MIVLNSMISPIDRRIPVTVLTGFLGADKTTVLNHLVRQPELRRTLVLINEFGEIGLDHLLVTQGRDDVIVEMSSGCLCCTIRGDLVDTLRDAPWRFARGGETWFDRVVIETTGLADPAPILHTLMSAHALAPRYRLSGVIATVDAVNGMDTLDRQFESVKQVAVADHLLLTKADLVETDAVKRIERRLHAFNPSATITRVLQGVVAPSILDAGFYDPATKADDVRHWLGAAAFDDAAREHSHHDHADHGHGAPHHADHDHAQHDVNRHDERIRAVCLTYDKPVTRLLFDRWLDILMHVKGSDLLRVKGIVRIADLAGPLVVHCVQHVFHPPLRLDAWPSADRRTRLVLITRDIDAAWLRNTLTLFEAGDGAAMQPAPAAASC
ncbi:MAG TPA: GTP-binding protein [Candidatus Competibacteraceae bacterium]|mgnify:CR=1 FL=1|nr:GTP-binding protein [Candidatus Competibacteraceae bacterium]